MDGPRNDACQWIAIRHETDYKPEIRQLESLAEMVAKRALPLTRAYDITMQHTKLVVVQSYGSRAEADLAKGALEDASIFRQRYRLTRREECVNTLRGPARGFK